MNVVTSKLCGAMLGLAVSVLLLADTFTGLELMLNFLFLPFPGRSGNPFEDGYAYYTDSFFSVRMNCPGDADFKLPVLVSRGQSGL